MNINARQMRKVAVHQVLQHFEALRSRLGFDIGVFHSCTTWLGAFGASSPKRLKLVGNPVHVEALRRTLTRREICSMGAAHPTTVTDAAGRVNSLRSLLSATERYPQ